MAADCGGDVAGLLLAGGQSRRMGGGDKCLRPLAGKTLLAHVVARAKPQVGPLVLNANGDPGRFADFSLPVAADVVEGFAGPLAGVLTGLEWAAVEAPQCRWVASFACDAPFLPLDLVARLRAAVDAAGADMACAASAGRTHPVFGLWPVALRHDLRRSLIEDDVRKVDVWTAGYRLVEVAFPAISQGQGEGQGEGRGEGRGQVDPFFNTNRPEDLEQAEELLAE